MGEERPATSRARLLALLGATALVAAACCGLVLHYTSGATPLSRGVLQVSSTAFEAKFSTSTSYCYEREDGPLGNCWKKKPGANTTLCTVDSGKTTCKCPTSQDGGGCHIDALSSDVPTTGRCAALMVYVLDGERKHSRTNLSVDVIGKSSETYCKDMVKNDEWKTRQIVKLPDDPPPTNSNSWFTCWPPNTWQDGRCQRRSRYLGESCWDGLFGAGQCLGNDSPPFEYATSCYLGKCLPLAWAEERHECSCAWLGWNFLVACSSANGRCNGHACVWNTGDGKKYCDYGSGQDW